MKRFSVGQTDKNPSVYAQYIYTVAPITIIAKNAITARKIYMDSITYDSSLGYVCAQFISNI
jgi:hypothetical protein